jgi:hypothetical protein
VKLGTKRWGERVERTLATVGHRADVGLATGVARACGHGLSHLTRRERALERIGGDQERGRDAWDTRHARQYVRQRVAARERHLRST